MFRRVLLMLAVAAIALDVTAALAQSTQRGERSRRTGTTSQFEIIPFGGYVWTFSRQITLSAPYGTGEIDITDSGFWGINLAINARPGQQLFLLYQRQDANVEFRSLNVATERAPLGVEYWHIGGLGGIPKQNGKMLPFTSISLGATRYIFKDADEDEWAFSMIFGLGVKVYSSEKFGVLLQGRLPWTLTDGGLGVGFGTGGGGVYVGGTGIAQIDLSGGLIIRL